MNLNIFLYLTDLVESINCCFFLVVITWVVLALISFMYLIPNDNEEEGYEVAKKILSYWKIMLFIFFVSVVIPSKKTMYLMIGATYLQDSSIPTKVSKALELRLDEYIADLSEEKKL